MSSRRIQQKESWLAGPRGKSAGKGWPPLIKPHVAVRIEAAGHRGFLRPLVDRVVFVQLAKPHRRQQRKAEASHQHDHERDQQRRPHSLQKKSANSSHELVRQGIWPGDADVIIAWMSED
jgi:hypothetical protein